MSDDMPQPKMLLRTGHDCDKGSNRSLPDTIGSMHQHEIGM